MEDVSLAGPTSSSVSGTAVETSNKPLLEMTDGRRMNSKALEPRRLIITIDSVHYYSQIGGICCAVLLNTSFDLRPADKLATAVVPLSANPAPSTSPSAAEAEQIDILEHLPTQAEYVQVAWKSGSKTIHLTPSIQLTTPVGGGGISGLGVEKHRVEEKPLLISLTPMRKEIKGTPVSLTWKFEDENCIYYPPSTNLLVIVKKMTDKPENTFPFELRLAHDLKVDLHSLYDRISNVLRLVAAPKQHDGWCFQITGPFKSHAAKKALQAGGEEGVARNDGDQSVVGLHVAARAWLNAQRRPRADK